MLKFLNKPYPFNDNFNHNLKVVFGISLGVFLFLQFFQPFELQSIESENKTYIFLGGSIITLLALAFNLLVLPEIFPRLLSSENWKIKKEILWNLWILFTIGIGYFFYTQFVEFLEFNIFIIIKILLISTIPVALLITINQDRLLKANLKTAIELNKKVSDYQNEIEVPKKQIICFISDNEKEKVEIDINDLLFIRSANNYIEIFRKKGKDYNKYLLRSSLQKAEENLKNFIFIFKCHRTSIVNINNITEITGNSQGYKLKFENIDEEIPVSRSYSNELKKRII